ncbi:MAG: HEAT repeat domain-containing protein [Pseudomonadota bacterium]
MKSGSRIIFLLAATAFFSPAAWSACPDQADYIKLLRPPQINSGIDPLLQNLQSQDPRDRWLAAEDLGRAKKFEAVSFLFPLLSDPNLEVRNRAQKVILEIGATAPRQFETRFRSGSANLDPAANLVLRGIIAELQGPRDEARDNYEKAFDKNRNMAWSAFRFADSTRSLKRIQDFLAGEINHSISLLKTQPATEESPAAITRLRQAHALTKLTEAVGRKISLLAADFLGSGRPREAEALNVEGAAKLIAAALELNNLAQKREAQLKNSNPRFQLSGSGPSSPSGPSGDDNQRLIQARLKAVEALGACYTAPGEAALIQTLQNDPSPAVRGRAAEALERLGTQNASAALTGAGQSTAGAESKRDEAAPVKALAPPPPPPRTDRPDIQPQPSPDLPLGRPSPVETGENPGTAAQPEDDAVLVEKQVQTWLQAWKEGDLDSFFKCYHPDFKYKNMNLQGFIAYKKTIAGKNPHIGIDVANLQVKVDPPRAAASFVQDYRADSYRDYGQKTLFFEKYNGLWLIKEENWRALPRR